MKSTYRKIDYNSHSNNHFPTKLRVSKMKDFFTSDNVSIRDIFPNFLFFPQFLKFSFQKL